MRFLSLSSLSLRNPNPNLHFLRSSLILCGISSLSTIRFWHFPPPRPRSVLVSNLRSPPGPLSVDSDSARSFSLFSSVARAMSVVANSAEEAISPAKKFWFKSQKGASLAKYTPFIVCLASGKLEQETFRQYIAQGVHFLRSFARAYEKAAEFADDDDDKDAISKLWRAVLDDIKLYNSVVQEWGIDPSKAAPSNPATIKYTTFLSATSEGKIEGVKGAGKIVTPFEKTKIAAYTAGAMAPFMRLFAFLSKELEPFLSLDGSSHPYASWMKNYSSSTFEEAAVQIEDLLDKLSVTLTGEELDVIQKLYHQAVKLGIEYLLAQPIVQPSVVPLSRLHDPMTRLFVFSDFDLTCTVLDSSSILAEIAIIKAPKSTDLFGDDNPINRTSSELKDCWMALSRQYTEEYEQCIESLLPPEQAETFDLEDLYKHLEQLSEFEKRANSRVIQSGVLGGMNVDDIKRAGERLNLQEGCSIFFNKIVAEKERLNADVNILSYCWCADLIRSAFLSVGCLGDVTIHSNEFEYEGSVSTGEILRKIESPLDKVSVFKNILDQNSHTKCVSMYIGDSLGDLLCLLEADVGIVVGSSESLRKVGTQFGISFVPLFQGLVHKQRELGSDGTSVWKGKSGVLYTASGWPEIQAFILGHEAS